MHAQMYEIVHGHLHVCMPAIVDRPMRVHLRMPVRMHVRTYASKNPFAKRSSRFSGARRRDLRRLAVRPRQPGRRLGRAGEPEAVCGGRGVLTKMSTIFAFSYNRNTILDTRVCHPHRASMRCTPHFHPHQTG